MRRQDLTQGTVKGFHTHAEEGIAEFKIDGEIHTAKFSIKNRRTLGIDLSDRTEFSWEPDTSDPWDDHEPTIWFNVQDVYKNRIKEWANESKTRDAFMWADSTEYMVYLAHDDKKIILWHGFIDNKGTVHHPDEALAGLPMKYNPNIMFVERFEPNPDKQPSEQFVPLTPFQTLKVWKKINTSERARIRKANKEEAARKRLLKREGSKTMV